MRGTVGDSTNPTGTSPLVTRASTSTEFPTSRLTRRSGWVRRKRASQAGARYSATVRLAAMVRCAARASASERAPIVTRSTPVSASRAQATTTSPSVVSREPLGVRTSSVSPS